MYQRLLQLPKPPKTSFFLWGPRQVGKSLLLKTIYPDALRIDLLLSREHRAFAEDPGLLRERALEHQAKSGQKFMIIDEVQKVPELLDEVHALIEDHRFVFALCGSSARKLKRGHANLLGGRALRYFLYGITARELGADFQLTRLLNRGYLPALYRHEAYQDALDSYCSDYLKEEIMAEGLIRKLPPFSRFLELAALSDTHIVSYERFASDCGVSAPTISSYFEILCDTLMGSYLPSYTKRPKRRTIQAPKFYFSDLGVVNHLAKRGAIALGGELFGKAFENWVHHELRCYLSYRRSPSELSYWALTTGVEVDFIIGKMECAIEVKSSNKIRDSHLKGLRELKIEYPAIQSRLLVSTEPHSRKTDDGIRILSVPDFIKELWDNKLIK